MDEPNQPMAEKMPYSLSAKYLPISRDKLIEMPQAFVSRLFEMVCEQAGEFQRSVVRNAEIIEVKKITFSDHNYLYYLSPKRRLLFNFMQGNPPPKKQR